MEINDFIKEKVDEITKITENITQNAILKMIIDIYEGVYPTYDKYESAIREKNNHEAKIFQPNANEYLFRLEITPKLPIFNRTQYGYLCLLKGHNEYNNKKKE